MWQQSGNFWMNAMLPDEQRTTRLEASVHIKRRDAATDERATFQEWRPQYLNDHARGDVPGSKDSHVELSHDLALLAIGHPPSVAGLDRAPDASGPKPHDFATTSTTPGT
jgi:hypothetical protein